MSTLSLRLPESIHRKLAELAEREGISINQMINSAVAEKLAALMTEEYLSKRAERGSEHKFSAVLAKVRDIAPDAGDELVGIAKVSGEPPEQRAGGLVPSRQTALRAFIVSGDPMQETTLRRGLEWLGSVQPLGTTGLILTPEKDQLTNSALTPLLGDARAKTLSSNKAVSLGQRSIIAASEQTLGKLSSWNGGPVLALWVKDGTLDRLGARIGVTAICAVAWLEDEISRWVRTFSPQDLATGAVAVAEPIRLDPVVVAGLAALTRKVNLSTGLAHPSDRSYAVSALRILKNAGYTFIPEDIHVWATQHGWNAAGARELADLASKVILGKRLKSGDGGWSDNILELWRVEAEGSG